MKLSVEVSSSLLSSKLKPPRLRNVLSRPRLLNLISPNGTTKLATIIAGPGYGKTTLMTQFAASRSGIKLWYQIDEQDNDPMVFLRNLVTVIVKTCELDESKSIEHVNQIEDIRTEGKITLSLLCEDLMNNLHDNVTICFDDWHILNNDSAGDYLSFLIKYLPDQVLTIITSRTAINMPVGWLRSQRMLSEITTTNLQFSEDELYRLLIDSWGLNVSKHDLEKLHDNVDGWVAGLVLMESHLKTHITIPKLSDHYRIQMNVFEFLAEEILIGLDESLRSLLMNCSLIDPIDPAICSSAFGIPDSHKLLDFAEKNNLFLFKIEHMNLYRLHPLFREFLQHQLTQEISIKGINKLHVQLADIYKEIGNMKEAVNHYLLTGSQEEASSIIELIGFDMLDNREYMTLSSWLEKLDSITISPTLLMYQGLILFNAGKILEAREILVEARSRLHSPKQKCKCTLAIAECFGVEGAWEAGIAELNRLKSMELNDRERLEVAYRYGSFYFMGFDDANLKKSCDEAMALSESLGHSYVKNRASFMSSMYQLRRGNFKKAGELLSDINDIDEIPINQRTIQINNLASCLMLQAKYKDALNMAEKCRTIAEDINDESWLSTANDTLGCILVAVGEEDKGINLLEKSIDENCIDSMKSKGYLYCHLGTFARWQHRYEDAMKFHHKALSIAKSNDEIYDVTMCNINIGADLLYQNQVHESKGFFKTAKELSLKYRLGYAQTRLELFLAWIAYLQQDEEQVKALITSAFERANKYQQNHFLIQEGKMVLPLFLTAARNYIEPDYVDYILEGMSDDSFKIINDLLQSKDNSLRLRAIKIIERCNNSAASMGLLRKVSKDENEKVKAAARAAQKKIRKRMDSPYPMITKREAQVLELIAMGATNSSIAEKLFISELTVKTHVTNLLRKLGLHTRLEAALYFQQFDTVKDTTFLDTDYTR